MRVKRVNLMEEYILAEKSVSLDTLCEKFQISKNTVRRDVDLLVSKGSIQKVYGGVTCSDLSQIKDVVPYEERHTQYAKEKEMISKVAASFVHANDTIYIDTGTTCLAMVDYLADTPCTIITNSLRVSLRALSYPNLSILSLPGTLKRETMSFVGSDSVFYLDKYNIDKAFMACTGISIENGLTNATLEEYSIKQAAIAHSKTHYLLADHSKFGHASLMTYAPLTAISRIITDAVLPAVYTTYCQKHNIQISFTEPASN